MASSKRLYNVNEVLSMLEDDSSVQEASVFIEPPPVTEDTDEDSGEEDGERTVSIPQWPSAAGACFCHSSYPGVGMGGEVVLDLIAELQEVEGCSFHLTFDNLFTSLKLLDRLSEKNIACTGTIRANRLEDSPLRDVKDMQKTPRGTFDYATDTKSGLIVVRWNDNNIVNVVSNKVGVHPLQVAKRWSRSESRQVQLPQPFLIRHYNQTMGGVDRTDQNVGKYRVAIRSKKWWWAIFTYCLDVCIQQVWHLYRATEATKNNSLDLLAIRRRVVRVYLGRASHHAAPGRPRGHVSVDKRVLEEIRFDRLDHLLEL
ncbi:piggyBac transposable element-derived protein 3-like [Littorina saxatilis]|uniref:piggyBac transposable element-derived protein 3-like n=1 Tax=Littorina saxatilis TaxID=31220 RepID=UPI0038B5AFFD